MQRRDIGGHRANCRGLKSGPKDRQKMDKSAVALQALFRGYWTRRRFKFLMAIEDKEMSIQNRMFRHIMRSNQGPAMLQVRLLMATQYE